MEQSAASFAWNPLTRILFRFTFVYLALYNLHSPLPLPPSIEPLREPYSNLWHKIAVAVGKAVFHKDITIFADGDTTYEHVRVFCFFVIAVVVAMVWTLLDRKRANYVQMYDWLSVYVRYMVALGMVAYGTFKIIKAQFPAPTLDRLVQPYGDSSPMGLLWTFMGSSLPYNLFTGIGETVGGLLLVWRRTVILGALVSVAVMSNVVMLNFSYDVWVKLYSMHLLAMLLFLLLPHTQRLLDFFLLNRTPQPLTFRPHFASPGLNRWMPLAGGLLVFAFTIYNLYDAHQWRKEQGDVSPKSEFYGIWNVTEIEVDREVQPLLITNETRWRRLIFDWPQVMAIQLMNDSVSRYFSKWDAEKKTVELTKRGDPNWKTTFAYERLAPDLLALTGTFEGKSFRAKLQRKELGEFLLLNRGFHWINEYSPNR